MKAIYFILKVKVILFLYPDKLYKKSIQKWTFQLK